MAETKFTPGPWEVMNNGRSALFHVETRHDNPVGAGLPLCSIPAKGNEERQANAYLIAAAPEMYAALKGILADDNEVELLSDERVSAIRAVLAKAEGRA